MRSIVGRELKKIGLMSMYKFLEKNPEENLPKLIDWLDSYMADDVLKEQREYFRNIIEEKNSNWYKMLLGLWVNIDKDVRKTMFENIVINANAIASSKAEKSREEYGCNIPWVISINIGKDNVSPGFDFWDSIIEQAKELGTFVFVFEGDEPLKYKEQIIALCNKHRDCEFAIFTNGKGIDRVFARNLLRVKNLIVVFKWTSVPDAKTMIMATSILRRYKLPFLTSCLYDETNQDQFVDEKFYKSLKKYGIQFVVFFSKLSEEIDRVYPKACEKRKIEELMSINFCKDSQLIGGCMGGGRYFCSIGADGGVKPCFFSDESEENLKRDRLIDIYRSKKFNGDYDSDIVNCKVSGKSVKVIPFNN